MSDIMKTLRPLCSQVTQALTDPTTRSLCEARGTVLYITKALDLFTGSGFKNRSKKVCPASPCSRFFRFLPPFSSLLFLLSFLNRHQMTRFPATLGRQRMAERIERGYGDVGRNQDGSSPEIGVPWRRAAGRLVQTNGATCCRRGLQQLRW